MSFGQIIKDSAKEAVVDYFKPLRSKWAWAAIGVMTAATLPFALRDHRNKTPLQPSDNSADVNETPSSVPSPNLDSLDKR